MRAKDPVPLAGQGYMQKRLDYLDYVASQPNPGWMVIQDLDDPPGYGAFWGEVQSNVHKALGCQGVVTNGCVRDIPRDPTPSQELHSREALAPVFADLNQYAATMHFVGQNTIFTLEGDCATGEAYCIAHHLTVDGEKRRLMVAYLRYLDTFAKIDGAWLFAERLLYVDWLEQRALS